MRKLEKISPLGTAGWGRPPAQWMYDLIELDMPDTTSFDYEEISSHFGPAKRTLQQFFSSLDLPSKFVRTARGSIKKVFVLGELKAAIQRHIDSRGFD